MTCVCGHTQPYHRGEYECRITSCTCSKYWPNSTPLVKEADLELERLLQEEEKIELSALIPRMKEHRDLLRQEIRDLVDELNGLHAQRFEQSKEELVRIYREMR